MQGFWRLISIFISLIGFAIAGVVPLVKGDPFEIAVFKAICAFVVLYTLQSALGAVLFAAVNSEASPAQAHESEDVDS